MEPSVADSVTWQFSSVQREKRRSPLEVEAYFVDLKGGDTNRAGRL